MTADTAAVCRQVADFIAGPCYSETISYSLPKGIAHAVSYLHGEAEPEDHRTDETWKRKQADRLGLTTDALFYLRWGDIRGIRDKAATIIFLRTIADKSETMTRRLGESQLRKLAEDLRAEKLEARYPASPSPSASKLKMDADIANRLPSESDGNDTNTDDAHNTTLHAAIANDKRENENSQWQNKNP